MRIHLLGLPHTETTREYSWCAYTQKTRKLASMMTSLGYDVRLYAAEANEADVTEHIPVVDRKWQEKHFSKYNWAVDVFNEFDPALNHWSEFNNRTIEAVRERMDPGDILGITMGGSQRPVADALPGLLPVEVGIGYSGIWAPHRVYESYAWMHYLAAYSGYDQARFYDAVIPNSFEPDEFPLGQGQGRYLLYIGRFIRAKGVVIASETAKRLGVPLILAGQGATSMGNGRWKGIDVEIEADTHLGVLGPEERAEWMGNARAVMVPTTYLEPFGGVAVEAMMCGTPVITTDWGAFTETVQQGVTGFRCNTLADFVKAGESVRYLNREDIREYAVGRYSVDVVKHQYDEYFRRLASLQGAGWYA